MDFLESGGAGMELVPLSALNAGEQGVIREVEGPAGFVKRLCEMGFCHGAEIQMVRPGAPCIVAMKDQRISLRGDDELAIYVEVTRPIAAR